MSQSVKQEYVRSAGIWICSLYTQGGQQQHQQDLQGKARVKALQVLLVLYIWMETGC